MDQAAPCGDPQFVDATQELGKARRLKAQSARSLGQKRRWSKAKAASTRASNVRLRKAKGVAASYNHSGLAKTRDHKMPMPGTQQEPEAKVRGKGKYKVWEPAAICKATFGGGKQETSRHIAHFLKGSHGHVGNCNYVVASTIIDAMDRSQERLHAWDHTELDKVHDSYGITTNMHDETKLYVSGLTRKKGAKRERVLACKAQYTIRDPTGTVHDLDIIRRPKAMKRYTAQTVGAAVADPEDCTGLWPRVNRPPVRFFGSLQAADQHSVNVLLSKWVVSSQAEKRAEKPEEATDPPRVVVVWYVTYLYFTFFIARQKYISQKGRKPENTELMSHPCTPPVVAPRPELIQTLSIAMPLCFAASTKQVPSWKRTRRRWIF